MKTQNTETKVNMINHSPMKLPLVGSAEVGQSGSDSASLGVPPNESSPNAATQTFPNSNSNYLWEYEPFYSQRSAPASGASPDDPAPGSTVSAYIKVRQDEAKRPPTREELRIGGPDSEGANASDAPPDSQRAGGPVTEAADAKTYQPGDMPPNAGPGFSDDPSGRTLPPITHSQSTQPTSSIITPSPRGEGRGEGPLPSGPDGRARRSARAASDSEPESQISTLISEIQNSSQSDNMNPDNLEPSSLCPSFPSVQNSAYSASSPLGDPSSSFTVLQSDWIELSPYGDFPHPRGIQRVDRDAAERIVAQFNSFWSKLGRRFAGVPVYIGHPDVPEYANEYTDKKAYGWITELQARGSGLFAKVKWSNQGRDFLQNAHYKFYSPYWEAIFIGEKDGRKIYRPTNLLSVGLTNQPNLPVPPLANEGRPGGSAASPGTAGLQPGSAIPLSNRHPIPSLGHEEILTTSARSSLPQNLCLSARSADHPKSPIPDPRSEIPSAPLQNPPIPLANEVLALQTLLLQRDERIHAMHAQFENARANWGSEQTRFENEICSLRNLIERLENSRIDIVLDHALQEGRIAPAERDFWNTQLRRDFEIRHEELKQRPEVMHMKSLTGDLGKTKVDLSNAATRKRILFELLEAKQRLGMKHDEAWFALKEERPDLFDAMQGNH